MTNATTAGPADRALTGENLARERAMKLHAVAAALTRATSGEQVTAAMVNEGMEALDAEAAVAYLADDDRWLDPACADAEIPDLLHDRELGLLFARSIFFWDNPNTFNAERQGEFIEVGELRGLQRNVDGVDARRRKRRVMQHRRERMERG